MSEEPGHASKTRETQLKRKAGNQLKKVEDRVKKDLSLNL